MYRKSENYDLRETLTQRRVKRKPYQSSCSVVFRLGLLLLTLNGLTAILVYRLINDNMELLGYVIAGVIAVANIILLVLGFSNPGIIPKKLNNFEFYQQCYDIPHSKDMKSKCTQILMPIHNVLYKMKYCQQCRIYRPQRTIHCSMCNQCVLQFDHHCQWIGVCIGKNNYPLFITSISTLLIALISILGGCIKHFSILQIPNLQQFIRSNFWIIITSILSSIFCIALIALLIYHFTIIFKGFTTNQDLKKMYGGSLFPFKSCSTWNCHRSSFDGFLHVQKQSECKNLETEKRVII